MRRRRSWRPWPSCARSWAAPLSSRTYTVAEAVSAWLERVPAVNPGARTNPPVMAGGGRGGGRQPVRGGGGWLVSAGLAEGLACGPGPCRAARRPSRAPTLLLGIDETRFVRPRWRQTPEGRWVLSSRRTGRRSRSPTRPGAARAGRRSDPRIRAYVEHGTANVRPFTWTATAGEILAKVAWVRTSVQQLGANNAKGRKPITRR